MSMADDHKLGSYRSPDADRRAAESPQPGGQVITDDPLAELARLIGQDDPFAAFGRTNSRQAARADAPAVPASQRGAPTREQQFGADAPSLRDPYGSDPASGYPPAHAGEDRAPESRVHEEVPLAADHQGQYYDERQGGEQYADEAHDRYDAEQYYQDDVPLEPNEDEMYDDPPHARRRGGLVTALVLVACAALGTAGAYAYRSYYAAPDSTQPPPVITADNSTPTKIVPAPAGDAPSGKSIDDRLGSANKEQLVSKQEEPLALKEPGPQAAPSVVAPPAAMGQIGPAQQPSSASSPASTEPKKIRTVTIRPDGADVSGQPIGAPALQEPGAVPAGAPRPAAPPPAPKSAANRSGGPLSLDPQASEPAAGAGRTQVATAPPARPAPEAAHGASDGFVVQLSSQKSESEALASFRALQAKFPNELGGRQPIIRRADLGSKGIFYRTLVGPFASAHEASQFCASYKAAGGQCVVPNR